MTLSTTGISTLDELRTHLQWAIELEHSTLPPHLLPSYPHPLPHSDGSVQVGLGPFGPEALELFLRIEQPARVDAPAQADGYATIGQFYTAIEDGLRELCATLGEEAVFSGDPARQIRDVHFRRGGGRVIAVVDLASALDALGEIVEQGEGATRTEVWDGDRDVVHPDRDEVAHYYRFVERCGPNPRTTDQAPGSPVREAQEEFNRTYCLLLQQLEEACTGSPAQLGAAVGTMYAVRAQALALLRMPDGDGGSTAGPTFEWVPRDRRSAGTHG